jgi:transcriptional regulator with XRE-family HTH domain
MEFYQQVRAARAILGWTQAELANRSGLSVPAINNLEANAASPTRRTQRRIIRVFEDEGLIFTVRGIERREEKIFIFDNFLTCWKTLKPSSEKANPFYFIAPMKAVIPPKSGKHSAKWSKPGSRCG